MIFILFCQMKMQYDLNLKNKKKKTKTVKARELKYQPRKEREKIFTVCALARTREWIYMMALNVSIKTCTAQA